MSITYLESTRVSAQKQTPAPRSNSRTGYGNKIPTSHMLQLDGKPRWRRVYVSQWSNSGSAYIVENGARVFLGSCYHIP